MWTSESLNEFAPAFIAFQGEVEAAKKDETNPFFKMKYADLSSVWNACRPHLVKHGLAVLQSPAFFEGRVIITTRILHKSGQWVEGALPLKPVKDDPQSTGSAITYGRRYSLGSFLGIITDIDDDGNQATGRKDPIQEEKPKEEVNTPRLFNANDEKHKTWIKDVLEKEKVAHDMREEIISRMDGKPFTILPSVIKEFTIGMYK